MRRIKADRAWSGRYKCLSDTEGVKTFIGTFDRSDSSSEAWLELMVEVLSMLWGSSRKIECLGARRPKYLEKAWFIILVSSDSQFKSWMVTSSISESPSRLLLSPFYLASNKTSVSLLVIAAPTSSNLSSTISLNSKNQGQICFTSSDLFGILLLPSQIYSLIRLALVILRICLYFIQSSSSLLSWVFNAFP